MVALVMVAYEMGWVVEGRHKDGGHKASPYTFTLRALPDS